MGFGHTGFEIMEDRKNMQVGVIAWNMQYGSIFECEKYELERKKFIRKPKSTTRQLGLEIMRQK